MAKKKKKASKPSAAKARQKPAGKTAKAAERPARKPHHHEHPHDGSSDVVEIELSKNEQKTVDMILDSDKLCQELETEAIAALSTIVRKFFRQHGTTLSAAQAQNVAMVLFGD